MKDSDAITHFLSLSLFLTNFSSVSISSLHDFVPKYKFSSPSSLCYHFMFIYLYLVSIIHSNVSLAGTWTLQVIQVTNESLISSSLEKVSSIAPHDVTLSPPLSSVGCPMKYISLKLKEQGIEGEKVVM